MHRQHSSNIFQYIGKYGSRVAGAHCISAVQCSAVQCRAWPTQSSLIILICSHAPPPVLQGLLLVFKIIANNSKDRHVIVFNFLKKLGLDNKTASADSEGIEHHVSDKTLLRMEKFNKLKKINF